MFNSLRPSDAYMRHETKPSLLGIVACRLAGASHHLKQCGILWIGPWETNFNNILVEIHHFTSRKCVWIWRLQKIASNLSRPHCVISLVTISTTTKFGKMSDELILMRGELISFSHTRWRHSCQRLCLLRYPLGFQWSPSTWVFFTIMAICHLITKRPQIQTGVWANHITEYPITFHRVNFTSQETCHSGIWSWPSAGLVLSTGTIIITSLFHRIRLARDI